MWFAFVYTIYTALKVKEHTHTLVRAHTHTHSEHCFTIVITTIHRRYLRDSLHHAACCAYIPTCDMPQPNVCTYGLVETSGAHLHMLCPLPIYIYSSTSAIYMCADVESYVSGYIMYPHFTRSMHTISPSAPTFHISESHIKFV